MNILLLYKNSTYATYFLSDPRRLAQLEGRFNVEELERFRKAHKNHFRILAHVESALKKRKLKYTKSCRGSSVNYSRSHLIITVGGDGTFLEAASHARKQAVWGVNSDPLWSVGRYCSGNPRNFEAFLDKILAGKAVIRPFNRLQLSFGDGHQPVNALNDILICHHNPAAMSRYYLAIGKVEEAQRSSGIWVATAAGSSGAILSAGGKLLGQESGSFQYKPREMYQVKGMPYRLKGSVLKPNQKIAVTSLMREGVVFVDGSHVCLPFSFGAKIEISRSKNPLNIVLR